MYDKEWLQKYSIVSRYAWYGTVSVLLILLIYGLLPKNTFNNVTTNEKIIKNDLVSIYNAQLMFMKKTSRYAASFEELNQEGIISDEITHRNRIGYIFDMLENSMNKEGFIVVAIPQESKDRKITIDQSGKIAYLK